MAASREWLIDKSAFVRLGDTSQGEEWASRIERGLVHICTVMALEIGFSARSGRELALERNAPPLSALVHEYLTPGIEGRAIEVQQLLASRGQHRSPSIPDILIAATAELAQPTILHFDKDFELISGITGQPTERLDQMNQ